MSQGNTSPEEERVRAVPMSGLAVLPGACMLIVKDYGSFIPATDGIDTTL